MRPHDGEKFQAYRAKKKNRQDLEEKKVQCIKLMTRKASSYYYVSQEKQFPCRDLIEEFPTVARRIDPAHNTPGTWATDMSEAKPRA
jgi:hypothetical protein